MSLLPSNKGKLPAHIDQSQSSVQGDQVAGDKINHYYGAQKAASVVEKLLVQLQHEIDQNLQCSDILHRLQRYHGGKVIDHVRGLEAKLVHSGRSAELPDALERKESFSMLLEEWSLYASAQEIFAHLLAKAEHLFNSEILPDIKDLTPSEINKKVNDLIVDPTVNECGASIFKIDHFVAMGMVYWLAEQCFVRWHS